MIKPKKVQVDQIQSVRIQNFKKIVDAVFDIAEINLLVGSNNSGKSSVIQGLHFGISILQSTILAKGKIQDGLSLNPNELLYSPSEDVYALGPDGKMFEDESKAINITITLKSGESCAIYARKGKNRNIAIKITNTDVATRLSSLNRPFTIFSPGLAGVAKREHYASDGVLLRTLARGDANLILRNILLRLSEDDDKWHAFISDLQELFPDLSIRVEYEKTTDEFVLVYIQFPDGPELPLELAGTGVLQALQILSYIHNFNPSLIVLDEPDSHLHPNNQRLLCSLLCKISDDRNTQVLLTTHSRHIVDALSQNAKFLWVRNGEVEPSSVDDEIGILMDIGALDIKERLASINAEIVILTEDEKTKYLSTLFDANGFDITKCSFLPYYGCTSIKNLRPLLNIIKKSNKKARIVVHRDRDYMLDEEVGEWEVSIRSLSVDPFTTSGVDAESHFINAEHLAKLNPKATITDFNSIIAEVRTEIENQQIKNYVNGRIDVLRKANKHTNIDHGQLAVEATTTVKHDPIRWFHGKETLKAIRKKYQELHQDNLITLKPTEFIKSSELDAIRKKTKKK